MEKILSSSCCIFKKWVFFLQKPNVWDGSAKIHFFEISSHQAWGIYKSQQFIQLLLCMKHRELLIIALSNAVTLMASENTWNTGNLISIHAVEAG